MNKIGLFWGSNTGNQEEATNYITDYMKGEGCEVELFNIAETLPAKMLEYKRLIIGCPTWHIGELQDDWDAIYEEYKKFDLSLALDGDDFLGFGLDNDNEEELTEERLIIWAELIKDEFGI